MDSNKFANAQFYTGILQQISTSLHLSLTEIGNRYSDYPCSLMDYCDKGVVKKIMEIRFNGEEVTITCVFISEEKCDCIYLFPDKEETIEGFVSYLKECFESDSAMSGWTAPDYLIKVEETGVFPDDLCLVVRPRNRVKLLVTDLN